MRIVRWHFTISGWSDYKLHCIGRGGAEVCECGHAKPDLVHMLWHCPLFAEARNSDPCIQSIMNLDLSNALLLGLPDVLRADPYGPGIT